MKLVTKGDRVSLNTSRRLYYFQGEGGINLRVETEEMAIIPDSVSEDQLLQINNAIKAEQLIPGWPEEKKIEVLDKDSDLKALLELGRNKIDEWIYGLREDKMIKSTIKTSKLDKIIGFEKAGKNRRSVISAAEKALEKIGGVSPVTETDHEKVEIKIGSGEEEEPK